MYIDYIHIFMYNIIIKYERGYKINMINYIEVLTEDERSRAIWCFHEKIEQFRNSKYVTGLFRAHKNNSDNIKTCALIEYWLNMMLYNKRIPKNIKKRAYNFLSKLPGLLSADMIIFKRRNQL